MDERLDSSGRRLSGGKSIDTEELTGRTFPYQFDRSLVEDIDLNEATPGDDLNWLEDIELMTEDGVNAVFDRAVLAHADDVFLDFGGTSFTYAQTSHRAARTAIARPIRRRWDLW